MRDPLLLFQTERQFNVSDRKTLFFCFRQKDTFFVSDRKTPQHVVQNRLPCCNFFSMRLFKYFFCQFSYKSIQEYVFQVSLKLVEGLWRYGWKKVTRNVTSYFIYRIYMVWPMHYGSMKENWLILLNYAAWGQNSKVKITA